MHNNNQFARLSSLVVGAAACIVFALMTPSAQASMLSVYGDIGEYDGGTGNLTGELYDGSGVTPPGGAGTTWNRVDDNTLHTGLLDSTGGSTSITFQTAGLSFQDAGGTPDPGLMGDDAYTGGGGFTFTNVPDSADGYDLYLYSFNGNTYSSTFAITTGSSDGPESVIGVLATQTTFNSHNYTVITGIHPSGGEIIGSITAGGDIGAGDFAIINGFQLVELPEPASLSLVAVGGLVVLRRRRQV